MIPLPGTKRMAAPLGMHAALFRPRSGWRHGRPCRTCLHVLRGRRNYCVRVVLLDAADPGGEPWSRRLQATARDGHHLCRASGVGARGDHTRCYRGAGAGNGWRIGSGRRLGAPIARREQSQTPNEGAEPVARPPGAPAPTGESDELRVPTVFRRLSAHVLKTAKPRPVPSQSLAQIGSAEMPSCSRGGIAAAREARGNQCPTADRSAIGPYRRLKARIGRHSRRPSERRWAHGPRSTTRRRHCLGRRSARERLYPFVLCWSH
jgi:hypothetical protein